MRSAASAAQRAGGSVGVTGDSTPGLTEEAAMDETAIWVEKLQIHELCARYTLKLDSHDIAGWASCFTEDGVFGFGGHAIRGRAKIAAYGDVHKNLGSRHINTSLCFDVEPSGQRATGRSAIVLVLATKRGYRTAFLGCYDDVLRKVDGNWLFSRRWVTADQLPIDPNFDLLAADEEMRALVQPLLDAYQRLGQRI
jgi:hypothetical protein